MKESQPSDAAESHYVPQVFGRDVLLASARQGRRMLDEAVRFWREQGFPYPRLTSYEMGCEFQRVANAHMDQVIQEESVHASTQGLRLANSFHPQMWQVPTRRHLLSPLDHFGDDKTLRIVLQRAARFWPNRRCWNSQCVRSAIRIYSGGRVSNFRPTAAKAIISRYSRGGDTVLDFSAGYGGRLLGCLTLDRTYLGIEPAQAQVSGLRQMCTALRKHASAHVSLKRACAEEFMTTLVPRSVDLIFSSPPYFNLERYSTEDSQSYCRYRSYQDWKAHFLETILAASHRALRKGGYLIINVADTDRHPIAADLAEMSRSLFHQHRVLKLLMHSRPQQRSAGGTFRWEPILVLKRKLL
jgi:hypothetical protein